jgi:hypothetical protein
MIKIFVNLKWHRLVVLAVTLATVMLFAQRTATAETVYNWTFYATEVNGPGFSDSGNFQCGGIAVACGFGTMNVVGEVITGITGDLYGFPDGGKINQLIAPYGFAGNNNIFPLDSSGVSFKTGSAWNFYASDDNSFRITNFTSEAIGTATFTDVTPAAAVPEINANSLSKALLFLACLLVMWGIRNNRGWCLPRSGAHAGV